MPDHTSFSNNGSVANYTSVTTAAQNQIYVPQTQSPNSLAFLMKNRIILSFELTPPAEDFDSKKKVSLTNTTLSK